MATSWVVLAWQQPLAPEPLKRETMGEAIVCWMGWCCQGMRCYQRTRENILKVHPAYHIPCSVGLWKELFGQPAFSWRVSEVGMWSIPIRRRGRNTSRGSSWIRSIRCLFSVYGGFAIWVCICFYHGGNGEATYYQLAWTLRPFADYATNRDMQLVQIIQGWFACWLLSAWPLLERDFLLRSQGQEFWDYRLLTTWQRVWTMFLDIPA